jgi:hypothetical protein
MARCHDMIRFHRQEKANAIAQQMQLKEQLKELNTTNNITNAPYHQEDRNRAHIQLQIEAVQALGAQRAQKLLRTNQPCTATQDAWTHCMRSNAAKPDRLVLCTEYSMAFNDCAINSVASQMQARAANNQNQNNEVQQQQQQQQQAEQQTTTDTPTTPEITQVTQDTATTANEQA